MGDANFGGAIFIGPVQNLTFISAKNAFDNNVASLDGGAIYFQEMDSYRTLLDQNAYRENKCGRFGDNIYLKQKLDLKLFQFNFRRRLQDKGPYLVSKDFREIRIRNTNFTTPFSNNQLFFENVFTIEISGSVFNPNSNSLAVEGGSIYLKNCANITISNSTFTKQESLVRGGAIYANQSEISADQSFLPYVSQSKDSVYRQLIYRSSSMVLSNNSFTDCSSQQGGCLYIMSVQNTTFKNANRFKKSTAVLYPSELKIAKNSFVPAVNKLFEVVNDKFFMGKGPVSYFNCSSAIGCTLDI